MEAAGAARHYQDPKSNSGLSDFANSSVGWMNKVPSCSKDCQTTIVVGALVLAMFVYVLPMLWIF
jgi:hypothetical protein